MRCQDVKARTKVGDQDDVRDGDDGHDDDDDEDHGGDFNNLWWRHALVFNYKYHNTIFNINIGIIIIVAISVSHNKMTTFKSQIEVDDDVTEHNDDDDFDEDVECEMPRCPVLRHRSRLFPTPNQMTSFLCGHKARQMPSSQAHNTILVIESKCHHKHIALCW